MWRIRYIETRDGKCEEYWNGDIFLDEIFEEVIKAVTQKNICLADIIIQDLEDPQYEIEEGMTETEVDDCEQMYDVAGVYDLVMSNRSIFVENGDILLPQIKALIERFN